MRIRKKTPADAALLNEEIKTAASVSDALAHPARIRMFRYILKKNLNRQIVTNKDLVKAFDYAQATISQHLSKLISGGLLEMKKRGTSSCYFVCIDKLSAYISILKKIGPTQSEEEIPAFLRNDFFSDGKNADSMSDDLSMSYFDTPEEEIPEL